MAERVQWHILHTVLTEGKADAALAASVFHYEEIKIRELKDVFTVGKYPDEGMNEDEHTNRKDFIR